MLNIEFFFLLILPWFADLIGQRFVMLSIVGLSLWALALLLNFFQFKTQDQKLKKLLRIGSRIAIFFWLSYWIYSLSLPFTPSFSEMGIHRLANVSHAALLVLAFAFISINALSAAGGLLKEKSLQDRQNGKFYAILPSIESLIRICQLTWKYAIQFWGLGLFLAIFSLWLRHAPPSSHVATHESDFSVFLALLDQPKLFVTFLLWLFLIVLLPLFQRLKSYKPQNYLGAYFIASLLFVSLFSFLIRYSESFQHQAIRWILR